MKQISSRILFGLAAMSVLALPALANPKLDKIIEDYETLTLASNPDAAARAEGHLAETWPDISMRQNAAITDAKKSLLSQIATIDQGSLTEDELLNLKILKTILKADVTFAAYDEARLPFTGDWGFQAEIGYAISNTRLKNEQDAVATIHRIEAIPAYLDAEIVNMRRGLATGFVSYTDPLETVLEQLADMQVETPEESLLYTPFANLPAAIPDARKVELKQEAKEAVSAAMQAFENVRLFLINEYAPHTREKAGIVDYPDAKAYYRDLVAFHTTRIDLTPEAVHEIGLEEVARIRAEMDAIIEEVGFEGSFAEFQDFLRTDPQFYARTPEELMEKAARFAKDIDFKMPEFFGHLPRLPYGVEPVPAGIAPGYTTGRYVQGSLKDGRAGQYWVNTYALDQRPLYELPSLTAHEAVPGHHHQIAISQELEDVPEFRRDYYATSFGEGWGLYSESLASEMGLYKTPYERFGKLSYEMWRACRLVADTGLHWYGWSREQAETCFRENTALAPLNIQTEVTRYIGWPGQALGYKIGELTIKSLREEAEEALGEAFDLREFHDVVLEKGALPLTVLETRVRNWVQEKQAGKTVAE